MEMVDHMINMATSGAMPPKKIRETVQIEKSRGRKGSPGSSLRIPDHGTAVAAFVRDGKVIRSDGKPYRG